MQTETQSVRLITGASLAALFNAACAVDAPGFADVTPFEPVELDLQFAQHTSSAAVARTIDSIEQQISRSFPVIKRIYIEAQLDLAAPAGPAP